MWRWLIDQVRAAFDLPPKTAPAVPFRHPVYGELGEDRSNPGFHAPVKVDWQGAPIDFRPDASFGTRGCGAVIDEACFATLDALLADQSGWHLQLKTAVLAEVYPIYLEDWRDPDEGPALSDEAFWSHLALESVSTYGSGEFSFVLDMDEEIPTGHVIDASGSIEVGFTDVALSS